MEHLNGLRKSERNALKCTVCLLLYSQQIQSK